MEELAEAVEEMAQKKSQLKMYRWAVGLLVSKVHWRVLQSTRN
jgi:hypothetical protein